MDGKWKQSSKLTPVYRRVVLIGCAVAAAVSLAACNPKEGDTSKPDGPTAAPTVTAAATETPPTEPPAPAETGTQPTNAPGVGDPGTYPNIGWVNATSLHIRPTPGTSGEAIGGLEYGDQVKVLGKEGDWYKIDFKKDRPGYVSAAYIQFTKVEATTAAPGADTTAAPTATTAA